MYEFLPLIAAAVIAGIGWNTVGIFSRWRSGIEAAIDWSKVKRNAIIGAVLGVVGWALGSIDAVAIPSITGPETFVAAIAAYFPLIVLADKIFTPKEDPTVSDDDDDFSVDPLEEVTEEIEDLKDRLEELEN